MASAFDSHKATTQAVNEYAKRVDGPLAAQNAAAKQLAGAVANAYAGTHWAQELGALVSQLEQFQRRGLAIVTEIKRINDRAKIQAAGI